MNIDDEYAGTVVLVHPNLQNDPQRRKKQVGVITQTDLAQDNWQVRFSDGADAWFAADALLVLGDTEEARQYAEYDSGQLFREDYSDIMEACMPAELPAPHGHWLAVELAQQSEMVREYLMHSLTDQLGLQQHKRRGR